MGLDFLILFLLALAFWWYCGRVIDDVLDRRGADIEWWGQLDELSEDERRNAT